MNRTVDPASFRDPDGFVYIQEGCLYRQVNCRYRQDYELLMSSGLYAELAAAGMLVPHEELSAYGGSDGAYKILKPFHVPFISYPHEWCFSQLKDAALLTLSIQKMAVVRGMSLKDASAFNVQFVDGRPLFIDTLSFERYQEGEPWVAYRQFCMHFLAPLALMSYCNVHLNEWFRVSVHGVSLELASALLPFKSRFNLSLYMHIFMHARSERKYADKTLLEGKQKRRVGKFAFLALIDSLEGAVKKLHWKAEGTEWGEYYQNTNYSMSGEEHKKALVAKFIGLTNARSIWDLGANDGSFSRIASSAGIPAVAFDIDPACVEKNYLAIKGSGEKGLLPLLQDLTNPSPGLGWCNSERRSLAERGPCDVALSLALIHHLAISNNVPLLKIAEFFAGLCNWLVVEFVPKEDSQVQRLLATRKDVFDYYNEECFEAEFGKYFKVIEKSHIQDSRRALYLMKKVS